LNDFLDETVSSEDLMARSGRRDRHAFEILVRRHQRSILNFIYRFIGDRIEAEDLAQEVFLKVWQSAPIYKPTAKFTTWIYRIAANLCINKKKSDRIKKWFVVPFSLKKEGYPGNEAFADHAGKAPSPEDLLLIAEKGRQVLISLQQLPADQRIALTLKKYDGLSYREIAQVMGRSVSAVDSLLVRAKRNLSEKLTSQEKKSQVFPL
jgi:RNA polymerase sigma-70 factor, ECF subfamily